MKITNTEIRHVLVYNILICAIPNSVCIIPYVLQGDDQCTRASFSGQ